MVFGHVLMHVGVVLSDIALRAAVGNSPKSEWRRVGVWTLELRGWDEKKTSLEKTGQKYSIVWYQQYEPHKDCTYLLIITFGWSTFM